MADTSLGDYTRPEYGVSGGDIGNTGGHGLIGGISDFLGTNSNTPVSGPNATAYNAQEGAAQANANGLFGAGDSAMSRQAAQINDPYSMQQQILAAGDRLNQQNYQSQLGGYQQGLQGYGQQLQDMISGKGPNYAQQQANAQLQAGNDAAMRQQYALANSGHGALAQGLGLREAQQNAAQIGQGNAAGASSLAAQLRQQQIANAMQGIQGNYGQMGQAYGLQQQGLANAAGQNLNMAQLQAGQAAQNAQLQEQQNQTNAQSQLGLYGLGNQAQGQSLSALTAYNQAQNAAQGTASQQAQANAKENHDMLSGVVAMAPEVLGFL